MNRKLLFTTLLLAAGMTLTAQKPKTTTPPSFSGIYPHLAMFNNEGECGTGAVVPWAGRLWVITYGPHKPYGSTDKLYEITPGLEQIVRKESIGGTPANRMIHSESNQLFIGPYAISAEGTVRTIPWEVMAGRHTGNARHLTDPAGKIYYATMEEGFYEVDVKTLQPVQLFEDGNGAKRRKAGEPYKPVKNLLPGAHGKGVYSGQGVLIYSNNGEPSEEALSQFDIEAGVLAEWDGKTWKVVRRNQFVEITGPGGIMGNSNPATDPIWATGWDHKSILLGSRDHGKWNFYRLPKASHTYDGAHGWNTEWPRIRDIGTPGKPNYLMTMHGMFWHFPGTFTSQNSGGIRPGSAYLKVIGDYTRWNDQLVMGCDDSAQKEFLNTRKVKGSCEGPGQSNSNLWFAPLTITDNLGPSTAEGAVWLSEEIKAGECSEPFLLAGWERRMAWVNNQGNKAVKFTFEIDKKGNNSWSSAQTITVQPNATAAVILAENGEWIRVKSDTDTRATVHFTYTAEEKRGNKPDKIFEGISLASDTKSRGGLLWGLGDNRRNLAILSGDLDRASFTETGYYELDSAMHLIRKEDAKSAGILRTKFSIPKNVITTDAASILIVDDRNRRWRLPKGNDNINDLNNNGLLRICREVATERDLFSCGGTFYELPAENADGFAKIRPIASHPFRIHDYASWRGLMILSGISDAKTNNPHIITSADGKASVWAGTIDDLWKLGKPVGSGGPWYNSSTTAGTPSDPYLIGFFDKRSLTLSHDSRESVVFTIEVEPVGHDRWMTYKQITVKPGEKMTFNFPETFQSRWIRFVTDKSCRATTHLIYK